MSDTSEASRRPASAAAPRPQPHPDRLYRVAAWVAIVGGILQSGAAIAFFAAAVWCLSTGRTPPWFQAGGDPRHRQGGK